MHRLGLLEHQRELMRALLDLHQVVHQPNRRRLLIHRRAARVRGALGERAAGPNPRQEMRRVTVVPIVVKLNLLLSRRRRLAPEAVGVQLLREGA